MSIDHHIIDSLNIVGILLGILGLLFVTYEFFGRRPLKWLLRVVTPAAIGAILLMPAGMIVYIFDNLTALILRGVLVYGMIGVLIGTFNGVFVSWPLQSKAPRVFSWRDCGFGFVISFCDWLIVSLAIWPGFLTAVLEAGIVALPGAVLGGVWSFLNWETLTGPEQKPLFSWRGCLCGGLLAGLLGFLGTLALGYTLTSSLIEGARLIPSGAIWGALWPICKQLLAGLPWIKSRARKDNRVVQATDTESEAPPPAKPPLFSWRGCLLGLITALLFGFLWGVVANLAFNVVAQGIPLDQTFADSVKGALTAIAFMGPAGALTGGLSRFFFWRAEGLKDGQLGGIGILITLVGFLVQLVPPIISISNISIH